VPIFRGDKVSGILFVELKNFVLSALITSPFFFAALSSATKASLQRNYVKKSAKH